LVVLHGRDPDHVDPKVFQIVNLAQDPRDISKPVTVGVLEGRRIDLVADSIFPPRP
jgi:hypothetical protein